MTAVIFPDAAVTDSVQVHNMNAGGKALVQCSADVTVFFWDVVAKSYQAVGTPLTTPGGKINVPAERARIDGTGTFNLRIVVGS